jgi:3-deoxy-7-phosphoheptulonate synthase
MTSAVHTSFVQSDRAIAPAPAVEVAGHRIGAGTFLLIAGPCAVESYEQAISAAHQVAQAGATMFRAGAFKPRTDHRSFQGLGRPALAILREVKAATGLPIVTELLDVRDLEVVVEVADLIQVGARNMQNYSLLRALGEARCPVVLKRGIAATIEETLKAADYVRSEGNERVVLCERGIRTFETAYRFTLDLTAVPILQERSGLPVIVDPSHAPGRRSLVTRLSKAAAAVGADGLIVEVHPAPEAARSDGPQQLHGADFAAFVDEVARIAVGEGRRVLRCSHPAAAVCA